MIRQKKCRKQFLSIALGFCMICSQTAYADITIEPMPWEAGAGQLSEAMGGVQAGISGNAQVGPGVGNTQYGPGLGNLPGGQNFPGTGSSQTVQNPSGTGNSQAVQNPSGTGNSQAVQNPSGTGSSQAVQNLPGAGAVQSGQNLTDTGAAQSGQNGEAGSTGGTVQAQVPEPVVESEGAVLMDASTGKVLYGKNQDTQFYPASITKVMTALLVLERCSLNDIVTFSASATTNLESGAVSLKITEGDQLTVEQALYGLLLKSANEIGNGLAEHVGGSISGFADLMNEKAKSLGCKNTHFTNPHGLNDSAHKTTPYDMALILRAALQNDTFRKIDSTLTYEFPATKNAGARTITMGHKMMYPSDSRYYQGIIGGKTGYTSLAGNTLVTGAERDGVRLIAVVMKSKGTHYTDTKALLDYGFANYAALTGGSTTAAASVSAANSSSETAASVSAANSASGPSASQTSGGSAEAGWKKDGERWYYIREDGQRAAGEWQTLSGLDYWFDADGYMATGWRKFTNGSWYYFRPSGGYAVKSGWVQDGGNWYYLGADGVLLTNTTTPDGYRVNADGIWIQE